MAITNADKQALLNGSATIPFKINIIQDGEVIKTLTENSIVDLDHEDFRYVDTESLGIGQFVARKVVGTLDQIYTEFEIEDTELELQMGVSYNGTTHYYSLGNFLVTKPSTDDVKDKTSFEAMDYTKKFNTPFTDTGLTFPCTALQLAQHTCNLCGVELATTDFANYDFEIPNNQYTEGDTCRKVMQDIGKLAYSWVRIGWDNKCYIDFEIKNTVEDYNTITNSQYYDLSLQKKAFGPVNRVVIGIRDVEGENAVIEDSASIEENGVTEIQLYDSNITYTPELRLQAINVASRLFGLTYTPMELDTIGHPWLEGNDKIEIVDMNGDSLYTYPWDRTIAYNGHIKSKISSKADTKTETEYRNYGGLETAMRQTRIIVDKQNQVIQSTVNTVTEQNNKISQITQTVDEINQKISDIADVTVSGESNVGDVLLENINASEPITIKVKPLNSNNNISYLYPNSNLYPSSTTYLKTRKIRFIRTYEEEGQTLTENIDYELPDDLLYYDSTHYDEFYLSHDSETCQITKKCKYNADGTVGLLSQEEINTYTYPSIVLGDGDYEVQLLGYDIGYLYVQLMASNIYTTQFATKVEMNSAINQKADEISLEVEEKLDSDEFTHAKIVAKINDDTSQVQIEADKIDLQGYITATDLAGTGTTTINGSNITTGSINANLITSGTLSANRISGGHLEIIGNYTEGNAFVDIISPESTTSRPIGTSIWNNGLSCFDYSQGSSIPVIRTENDNGYAELAGHVVNAYGFNNISLEERKKNFEKLNNALSIIKDIDIYKYNYKNERDDDKKHIGLVIGENYNYSKEVTSNNNEEVDIYSLVSVCCQAIKELQKEINELKKESEK